MTIREIEPSKAVDRIGRDVRAMFLRADGVNHVMPNRGDAVELRFPSPPPNPGLERSVFLKATGYYDVHLNAAGPAKSELLTRFENDPDFLIAYSFREYLDWRARLLADLGIGR